MLASDKGATAPVNLFAALRGTIARDPERIFLRRDWSGDCWTRAAFAADAGRVAAALAPFARGRFAAGLLMGNIPEYFIADLGVLLAGGLPISLYPTSAPEQLRYVIGHAGISVLFVERAKLATLLAALRPEDAIAVIVVVDGAAEVGARAPMPCLITTLDALIADADTAITLDAAADATDPDDLLTIIYTSGTTGEPKGVQLSHRNFLTAARGIGANVGLRDGDRIISWLPHAHVAERTCSYVPALLFGLDVTFCDDAAKLPSLLPQVEPHWFGGFPRMWERFKLRTEALLADAIGEKPARDLVQIAQIAEYARQQGTPVPEEVAHTVADADARHFAPLRKALGLSQVRMLTTGSAPTPHHILEFFAAIGLPIYDMYGASETCTYGTMVYAGRMRIGSAGQAAPNTEIAIAADGEILIRGPSVMPGYLAAPAKNAEVLTDDGWYRTGDLGRIDPDGFLWVTGRKKEVMINSSGHNMAPAHIEATVKAASPLVAQVCAIGEARPFVTALVTLDPDVTRAFANRWGTSLPAAGWHILPAIEAELCAAVAAANGRLARVEQIKRFLVLPGEWVPGSDELTPTQKMRRERIASKYAAEIEALYHDRSDAAWLEPATAAA